MAEAIKYNLPIINSVRIHANRNAFMKHLDKDDFDVLFKRYITSSFPKRLINKIKTNLR